MPGVKSILADRQGQPAESRPAESRDSGHPVWGSVVRARAANAKADREAQAQTREAKRQAESPRMLSDLEELQRGLDMHTVSTEAREEKPMRGVKIPRPLSREDSERIDSMPGPTGDALRAARDRGDIRYDVRSGKWLAYGPGIPATPAREAVQGADGKSHFPKGYFQGTARRQREREAR